MSADFWDWSINVMAPGFKSNIDSSSPYLNDDISIMIGSVRFRQIRVKNSK